MANSKREKKAQLYLFSEWSQDSEERSIKDPEIPGVVIGTVEGSAAHRQGKWHGRVWSILFRDRNLDDFLVQHRTVEEMMEGSVGTRETLSASGHIDERICMKADDRLPYTGIPHKAAYTVLGQNCFYQTDMPADLVLVELGYIRNKEIRKLKPKEQNNEHVWLYTGIYPSIRAFNFDPAEATGGGWRKRAEITAIIKDNNAHQRRKYITDELVLALSFLNRMEEQLGGREALSKYICRLLLDEHDRIAEYRRKRYLHQIGVE